MNELALFTKQDGVPTYIGKEAVTEEEGIALYNAMANPSSKLKDMINTPLYITNIYMEKIELTNEETGEVTENVRTVLIDQEGASFQCVSVGVFQAVKRLIAVFGPPAVWQKPMKLVPKLISSGKNQIMTLERAL